MGRPLLPAYVLSAVAVVAAILGSLVIFETASIKLTVPASRIVANKTLKGGPSGADIATTRIQADVTDSEHGTTASAPVPSVEEFHRAAREAGRSSSHRAGVYSCWCGAGRCRAA